MPRKVKIAPHLVKYFRMLDTSVSIEIRLEFRALLAVAREVQSWMHYDGEGWDGIVEPKKEQRLQGCICKALQHLERISKGDKSCPAK
jgi:hypothetical protein